MGNSTNNTPRTVSLNIALAIAVVAFLVGAGIGVAVWIAISGGSGEASVSAEQRAPQLSLGDDATDVPPIVTTTPTNTATPTDLPPTSTPRATSVPPTDVPPTATTTPTNTATPTRRPTNTPAPTATTQAQAAPAITRALYRIDSTQSEVRFLIDEDLRGQRITVVGKTNQVGGDIIVNFANPSASQVGGIVINARTLETDNGFRNQALRGQILRSADPAYEFIEFTPKRLLGLPASAAVGETVSFQMVGDLKVIEVTREVTFDVTLTVEEGVLRGTATAQILYKDFNITIPSVPGVANISDEVGLELDFVATLVEAR